MRHPSLSSLSPLSTTSLMPKHLAEKFRDLRAKADAVGLTQSEEHEYLILRRLMLAYEQVSPLHQVRVAYDKQTTERLYALEEEARELRERAEYLQGIRQDPPVPRKPVYVVKLTRPKL
jgi:hypothetical protein